MESEKVDRSMPPAKNSNSECRGLQGMDPVSQGMDPVSNQDAPIPEDSSQNKLIECTRLVAGAIFTAGGVKAFPSVIIETWIESLSDIQNFRKKSKNEEIEIGNTANNTPEPTRQWADGFVTPPTVKKWSGENTKMLFESNQGYGKLDIKYQDHDLCVAQPSPEVNDNKFAMVKKGIARTIRRSLILERSTLSKDIATVTCDNLTTPIFNDLRQNQSNTPEQKELLPRLRCGSLTALQPNALTPQNLERLDNLFTNQKAIVTWSTEKTSAIITFIEWPLRTPSRKTAPAYKLKATPEHEKWLGEKDMLPAGIVENAYLGAVAKPLVDNPRPDPAPLISLAAAGSEKDKKGALEGAVATVETGKLGAVAKPPADNPAPRTSWAAAGSEKDKKGALGGGRRDR